LAGTVRWELLAVQNQLSKPLQASIIANALDFFAVQKRGAEAWMLKDESGRGMTFESVGAEVD